MARLNGLLKKMWRLIEEQKQDIDSFYKGQQQTITDLYRVKSCSQFLENDIKRLSFYLKHHSEISPNDKESMARSLNSILIETNIIKATDQALNDHLDSIRKTQSIQGSISGKMLRQKKELNELLKKAEKIINRA